MKPSRCSAFVAILVSLFAASPAVASPSGFGSVDFSGAVRGHADLGSSGIAYATRISVHSYTLGCSETIVQPTSSTPPRVYPSETVGTYRTGTSVDVSVWRDPRENNVKAIVHVIAKSGTLVAVRSARLSCAPSLDYPRVNTRDDRKTLVLAPGKTVRVRLDGVTTTLSLPKNFRGTILPTVSSPICVPDGFRSRPQSSQGRRSS